MAEHEGTSDGLNAAQGVKAYDSVRHTFSRNGIPAEQSKAYIAMIAAPPASALSSHPRRFSISLWLLQLRES